MLFWPIYLRKKARKARNFRMVGFVPCLMLWRLKAMWMTNATLGVGDESLAQQNAMGETTVAVQHHNFPWGCMRSCSWQEIRQPTALWAFLLLQAGRKRAACPAEVRAVRALPGGVRDAAGGLSSQGCTLGHSQTGWCEVRPWFVRRMARVPLHKS